MAVGCRFRCTSIASRSGMRSGASHNRRSMHEAIRTLVREKLRDGRLPFDSIHRLYGGPADGEMCDACDEPIARQQVIIEGITSTLRNKQGIQFHVRCFEIWETERRVPGT